MDRDRSLSKSHRAAAARVLVSFLLDNYQALILGDSHLQIITSASIHHGVIAVLELIPSLRFRERLAVASRGIFQFLTSRILVCLHDQSRRCFPLAYKQRLSLPNIRLRFERWADSNRAICRIIRPFLIPPFANALVSRERNSRHV